MTTQLILNSGSSSCVISSSSSVCFSPTPVPTPLLPARPAQTCSVHAAGEPSISSPFLVFPLVSPCYLEVRPSLIPGAGCGLFTKALLRKDSVVCEYRGWQLTLVEVLQRRNRKYVMGGFGLNCHVDAPPEVLARYINDSFNTSKLNCRFRKQKSLKYAQIIATRDIQAGEELYASYGSVYWKGSNGTSRPPESQS